MVPERAGPAARTGGVAVLAFGGVAYALFLVVFAGLILFLAGAGPRGIDNGEPSAAWLAVCVNLALLLLFAVQHSVMARRWFKQGWSRRVPPAIERSCFVLAATAVLALLIWQWHPLPAAVWSVDPAWARLALWGGYGLGWALVVFSSFLLGHLELFGVRQVLRRFQDRAAPHAAFRAPSLYRYVRHPLLLGFLIAFWSTPDMSAGRLLFAIGTTAYILIAVRFEERDLRDELGPSYEEYQQRVPRFVPRSPRRGGRQAARRYSKWQIRPTHLPSRQHNAGTGKLRPLDGASGSTSSKRTAAGCPTPSSTSQESVPATRCSMSRPATASQR